MCSPATPSAATSTENDSSANPFFSEPASRGESSTTRTFISGAAGTTDAGRQLKRAASRRAVGPPRTGGRHALPRGRLPDAPDFLLDTRTVFVRISRDSLAASAGGLLARKNGTPTTSPGAGTPGGRRIPMQAESHP